MDSTDKTILSELIKNSRIKVSDLAQKVDMSVSTVSERIKKLENSGMIEKYSVKLNTAMLNRGFHAIIGICTEHPRYIDGLTQTLMHDPNIVECFMVTGEYDYIARISASSPEHFKQIHYRIARTEGVKSIKSFFIIQSQENPNFDPLSEI